ncbi:SHOCT-like domain-containing protein [Clostridium hydrogeniformans]|uniref:SHOCT-like domain-containing protein n=1 Tax=Clostridium hydrogeniformans TaxID=349933 RepID=UPI000489F5D4|nr:hypothetical protein [Clostridium hydrogeniformans]
MKEDLLRVLKMVEEGKISGEKAEELIAALKQEKETSGSVSESPEDYEKRILKVKVLSSDGDDVSVNLPISFIKGVLKSCKELPINVGNMKGIDKEALMNTLIAALDNNIIGNIVEVNSGDGDKVRIFIE